MRETTKDTNENGPRLSSSHYSIHFESGPTMGFAVGPSSMAMGNTNKMRVSSPNRNTFDYLAGADLLVGTEMVFRARKQGKFFVAREYTVRVVSMRDGGWGRVAVTVEVVSSREL